jgi:hypothetical protein
LREKVREQYNTTPPFFLSLHSFFSSFWMVPVRTARVLRGSFFPFGGSRAFPAQFPSARSHFELNTYFPLPCWVVVYDTAAEPILD